MDSTIRGASLHRLKDHGDVCSKRRMAAAAAEIVDGLDGILEATRRAVHVRSRAQGFQLMAEATRLSPEQLGVSNSRPGEIRPSEETFLEFAVLDAWRAGSTEVVMPWERLVGRQVPLMSRRESEGWGSIDLLGLDAEGRPVVVELKKAASSETPLRALLEAAGYAIAVQANWRVLSEEIQRTSPENRTRVDPHPTTIVVAAPEQYWQEWDRWSLKGRGVPPETRQRLTDVAEALSDAGIPSAFVALDTGGWDGSHRLEGDQITFSTFMPW